MTPSGGTKFNVCGCSHKFLSGRCPQCAQAGPVFKTLFVSGHFHKTYLWRAIFTETSLDKNEQELRLTGEKMS